MGGRTSLLRKAPIEAPALGIVVAWFGVLTGSAAAAGAVASWRAWWPGRDGTPTE